MASWKEPKERVPALGENGSGTTHGCVPNSIHALRFTNLLYPTVPPTVLDCIYAKQMNGFAINRSGGELGRSSECCDYDCARRFSFHCAQLHSSQGPYVYCVN